MQVQKDEVNKLMEKLNIKLALEDRDLEGKMLMKVGLFIFTIICILIFRQLCVNGYQLAIHCSK